MIPSDQLRRLCDEMRIKIVPRAKRRDVRETCSINTLETILRDHGEDHLRSVLMSIVETGNNSRQLISTVLWAVSDVLLAHPSWLSGSLLDVLDGIDLGELHSVAKANRRAARPRYGVATLLFDRLRAALPPEQGMGL